MSCGRGNGAMVGLEEMLWQVVAIRLEMRMGHWT
jgi:hypothetical protein